MNHILCSYAEVLGTIKHFSIRFAKTIIQHNSLTAVNFSILTAVFLFYSPTAAAALNCDQKPSCEELGYSKYLVNNCASDGFIYCPFDQSYFKCVQFKSVVKSCSEQGFTNTSKSSWCGKIVSCSTDAAYTLCESAKDAECPADYSTDLTSIASCGLSGNEEGWKFASKPITGNNGNTIVCGKCTAKTCVDYGMSSSPSCTGNTVAVSTIKRLGDFNGKCYECMRIMSSN